MGDIGFLAQAKGAAKVTQSNAQSIPNGVSTLILWNVEEFDTDDLVDLGINDDRITFQKDGIYNCYGVVNFNSTTATFRVICILSIDGSQTFNVVQDNNNKATANNVPHAARCTSSIDALADDFLKLFIFQDSGVARVLIGDVKNNGMGVSITEPI